MSLVLKYSFKKTTPTTLFLCFILIVVTILQIVFDVPEKEIIVSTVSSRLLL